VVARLDRAAIPYMLTGSLAMNYYTVPRMTRDIDLVVEAEAPDAARIVALFDAGYYVSLDAVTEAIAARSSFNLIEQATITKVDLFPKKRDTFRQAEFARRRKVAIADFSIWIVSPEDLALAKMLWASDTHSAVQLSDVRALMGGTIDQAYVRKWVRALGLETIWAEVSQ
jgi:hypothetical protein